MEQIYLYLSYGIFSFAIFFGSMSAWNTYRLYKRIESLGWRDAHRVILTPLFTGILIGMSLDFFLLDTVQYVTKVLGELN